MYNKVWGSGSGCGCIRKYKKVRRYDCVRKVEDQGEESHDDLRGKVMGGKDVGGKVMWGRMLGARLCGVGCWG